MSPSVIFNQIASDSLSVFLPDASALYKAIHRLERENFIAHSPMQRAYTLTPKGQKALRMERERYLNVAGLFRQRVR